LLLQVPPELNLPQVEAGTVKNNSKSSCQKFWEIIFSILYVFFINGLFIYFKMKPFSILAFAEPYFSKNYNNDIAGMWPSSNASVFA